MELTFKNWNIEDMTGYKPITTFYMDFSIADHFGLGAVKDTYKRAFDEWKSDYKYLTELVMALNWKIWEHYEHRDDLARLYDRLWRACDAYAVENLTDDELSYFYKITD